MQILPKSEELKKFSMEAVGPDAPEVIQETERLKANVPDENIELLNMAYNYWSSLRDARDRRKRNRLYYRGDQWQELMTDPDDATQTITEETYIMNQGKIPFKQNVIRQVVKNMLGQARINPTKTIVVATDRERGKDADLLSNAIRNVQSLNFQRELDARTYEEFLLSGMIFNKLSYKYWKTRNQEDVFIENVNPTKMFFNTDVTDIRLFDLRCVGELIDVPLDEVISKFAMTADEEKVIKGWYTQAQNWKSYPFLNQDGLSANRVDGQDFYLPYDASMCRVIEIWYLKSEWRVYAHDMLDGTYNIVPYSEEDIAQINAARIEMGIQNGMDPESVPLIEASKKKEQFWAVKIMTPWGHTLYESETPYIHEEHPYVLGLYPLVDGEVWGFIEDIIDQQRYINRLISLLDFVIGSSAKGVLLVPEEAIPDDMDIDDFADEWTKYNGVIKIKTKAGIALPEQIVSKHANIGASELLSLQMKLLQDISGVHAAIQGQNPKSGTPSSLYAQEAQNATINVKDYMEFFGYFKQRRDMKVLKLIIQFYQDKRMLALTGTSYNDETLVYDPERIRDLECEVKVEQSTDTPVYRQITDDLLFELLKGQLIDLEMFLENSSVPFADKMLEQVRLKKQEMMQQGGMGIPGGGQAPGMISPEMLQEASGVEKAADKNITPQSKQIIDRLTKGMGQNIASAPAAQN